MAETVADFTAILAYLDGEHRRFNAFTDVGASVVVTFSFPEADELPPGTDGSYGVDAFATFTDHQRAMAREVIAEAAHVSGIIFVEVDGGDAMINLYSGLDNDGGGLQASGYASYGMGLETETYGSDLVMVYQDFTPGEFAYEVLLHELGHALGLSHTHEGGHVLDAHDDHNDNTVMTYSHGETHAEGYGLFDQQALAHLYGGAAATDGFVTKVNGQGLITIIASGRNDTLIAADIGSKLFGKHGKDTLFGREGDDILLGGRQSDMLQGGLGDDAIKGNRGNDKIIGDIGDPYFGGKDRLEGGRGKDVIRGEAGADHIEGNHGSDRLDGGNGADRIMGGKGHDRITGGRDNDRLSGGLGDDRFIFTNFDNGNRDVITDFRPGEDKIDFTALGFATAKNIDVSQNGAHTEIYSFSYDLTLVLLQFDSADFDIKDISFA